MRDNHRPMGLPILTGCVPSLARRQVIQLVKFVAAISLFFSPFFFFLLPPNDQTFAEDTRALFLLAKGIHGWLAAACMETNTQTENWRQLLFILVGLEEPLNTRLGGLYTVFSSTFHTKRSLIAKMKDNPA